MPPTFSFSFAFPISFFIGTLLPFWTYLFLSPIQTIEAATLTWKEDSHSIQTQFKPAHNGKSSYYEIKSSSNRDIISGSYLLNLEFNINYDSEAQLGFQSKKYSYNTSCLSYKASAKQIQLALNKVLEAFHNDRSSKLYRSRVHVSRTGNGTNYYDYGYKYNVKYLDDNLNGTYTNLTLAGIGHHVGCDDLMTRANFVDSNQWLPDGNTGPNSNQDLIISGAVGEIIVNEDVTVKSITQNQGILVLGESFCGEGWTPSVDTERKKCMKAMNFKTNQPYYLTWEEAESVCQSLAPQDWGHLVRIESFEEDLLVRGICQNSGATDGCWIGLYGGAGYNSDEGQSTSTYLPLQGHTKLWRWIDEHSMTDVTYRSWEYRQPNNAKHKSGYENCTVSLTSTSNPFRQEFTAWDDRICHSQLPFICSKRATTFKYSLNVNEEYIWRGGTVKGPGYLILNGNSEWRGNNKFQQNGGNIYLQNSLEIHNNGNLQILAKDTFANGVTLKNYDNILFTNGSSNLKTFHSVNMPIEKFQSDWEFHKVIDYVPVLINFPGAKLQFDTMGGYTSEIFWNLRDYGEIHMLSGNLDLLGGGMMKSSVLFTNSTSLYDGTQNKLLVGGKSLAMMSIMVQELRTSALYPVSLSANNYPDSNNKGNGVYRLSFDGEETACIPYHASAKEMENYLNDLQRLTDYGGVSVLREGGDYTDDAWNYGYKYKLIFDSLSGYNETLTSLRIEIACDGNENCGCLEPLASNLQSGSNNFFCPEVLRNENSSHTSSKECTIKPTYEMKTLFTAKHTKFYGLGQVKVNEGNHLLPQRIVGCTDPNTDNECTRLILSGGISVTSARNFTGHDVTLKGGRLLFAGTGFEGLDVIQSLHESPMREGRNAPWVLQQPDMVSYIDNLHIVGGNLSIASSIEKALYVKNFYFSSGSMSGRINVISDNYFSLHSTEYKEIRNGLTLVLNGLTDWDNGLLVAGEGAGVINYGNITVLGTEEENEFNTKVGTADTTPGRSYQEGWYTNPLCADFCDEVPFILNDGRVLIEKDVEWKIETLFIQNGRFHLLNNSNLVLKGGGTHTGVFKLEDMSALILDFGELHMNEESLLLGPSPPSFLDILFYNAKPNPKAMVSISAGRHVLPKQIGVEVAISGGAVTLPWSLVEFEDNVYILGGLLAFTKTMAFITAQADFSVYSGSVVFEQLDQVYRDRAIEDDRSRLYLQKATYWRGGSWKGWAWVNSYELLDIDGGDKFLGGGLQMAYFGTCKWGEGDIIAKQDATLLHRGLLMMKNQETFSGSLQYLNTYDGCCPYLTTRLLQWEEGLSL